MSITNLKCSALGAARERFVVVEIQGMVPGATAAGRLESKRGLVNFIA
jgi:hypothetical protein